jgi:hypothetical protein
VMKIEVFKIGLYIILTNLIIIKFAV